MSIISSHYEFNFNDSHLHATAYLTTSATSQVLYVFYSFITDCTSHWRIMMYFMVYLLISMAQRMWHVKHWSQRKEEIISLLLASIRRCVCVCLIDNHYYLSLSFPGNWVWLVTRRESSTSGGRFMGRLSIQCNTLVAIKCWFSNIVLICMSIYSIRVLNKVKLLFYAIVGSYSIAWSVFLLKARYKLIIFQMLFYVLYRLMLI